MAKKSKPTTKKAWKSCKQCIVPICTNTSRRTPDKIFVNVPRAPEVRKKWFECIGRSLTDDCTARTVYCCEDHFKMPDDIANYKQFKMVGGQVIIKEGVVPRFFLVHGKDVETPPCNEEEIEFIGAIKKEVVDIDDDSGEPSGDSDIRVCGYLKTSDIVIKEEIVDIIEVDQIKKEDFDRVGVKTEVPDRVSGANFDFLTESYQSDAFTQAGKSSGLGNSGSGKMTTRKRGRKRKNPAAQKKKPAMILPKPIKPKCTMSDAGIQASPQTREIGVQCCIEGRLSLKMRLNDNSKQKISDFGIANYKVDSITAQLVCSNARRLLKRKIVCWPHY